MEKNEHIATVMGRNLPISTKHTIAISKFIRGKSIKKSKALLEKVLEKKVAVPFTVHKRDMPHRTGAMASGRYPQKATEHVIALLKSLEANANDKGLNTQSLVISEIVPNKASAPFHPGRFRRRKMRRTHLKIIAEEKIVKKAKVETKKADAPKAAAAKKTVEKTKAVEKKESKK